MFVDFTDLKVGNLHYHDLIFYFCLIFLHHHALICISENNNDKHLIYALTDGQVCRNQFKPVQTGLNWGPLSYVSLSNT